MNNYIGSYTDFFPVRGDMPHPDSEIPPKQDRVGLVALPAINQLVDTNQGNTATVHASDKRKMDVLEDPIQPSKRLKQSRNSFIKFRLVFSKDTSLGEVIIRRSKVKTFTEDEDKFIIDGKIVKIKAELIAKRIPSKTGDQIQHRWGSLVRTNRHLNDIVKVARLEQARLIKLERVQPNREIDPSPVPDPASVRLEEEHAIQKCTRDVPEKPIHVTKSHKRDSNFTREFPLVFSTPDSLEKVYIRRGAGGTFTEADDKVIIQGKVIGYSDRRIADSLPGKTANDVRLRWTSLNANNPHCKHLFQLAGLGQVRLQQIDPDLLQELYASAQYTAPPSKRATRNKRHKHSSGQLRLVFSQPNSLGEVFLNKGPFILFTDDEDKVIIQGRIDNEKLHLIAQRIPSKTRSQISGRWASMRKANPHLEDIVKLARKEKASLLHLELAKPAVEVESLTSHAT